MSLTATIEKYATLADPAPGFDKMKLLRILGWQSLVRRSEFPAPDGWCVFVPPEMSLEPRAEHAFMARYKYRVRVQRMKGILSQGLVLPVPPSLIGAAPGTDVASAIGAFRTPEPAPKVHLEGERLADHPMLLPYPDFLRLQYVEDMFVKDELIVVSEKLHGTQFRAVWTPSTGLLLGSHHTRRNLDSPCLYAEMARKHHLEENLRSKFPNLVLYGEVVGPRIQKGFHYDLTEPTLFLFDVYDHNAREFLPVEQVDGIAAALGLRSTYHLVIIFDKDLLYNLAEAPSDLTSFHCREGLVIHATDTRIYARRSAKIISNKYLETKE